MSDSNTSTDVSGGCVNVIAFVLALISFFFMTKGCGMFDRSNRADEEFSRQQEEYSRQLESQQQTNLEQYERQQELNRQQAKENAEMIAKSQCEAAGGYWSSVLGCRMR